MACVRREYECWLPVATGLAACLNVCACVE